MNRSGTQKKGTKEHGQLLKRIIELEDMQKDGKSKGEERRVTGKECESLREEFEAGGFVAPKGQWNIARRRMLENRGALSTEEVDPIREYKAVRGFGKRIQSHARAYFSLSLDEGRHRR